MNLTEISIRNRVFAWMLMFGLMVFGWISFGRMGVSLLPDVDYPVLNISASWEGAAPEIIESEIVDPIEDAMTGVEGLKEMSSSSRRGSANITLEFNLSRDVDLAMQDVQSKLSQVRRHLPIDVEPPTVSKSNPEDRPIMFLALTGTRPLRDIMDYANNRLRQQFQAIPGVGEIFIGGLQERMLRVWVDSKRLAEKQLTVEDVLNAIRRQHEEIPAGVIEGADRELNVRVLGEYPDAESFAKMYINYRGGQRIHVPIRLSEVARVEDGLADARRISRVEGQRSVGLGIRKQRGANAVEIAERVKAKMAEVGKSLPEGMRLAVNFDTTRFIGQSVHEMSSHLILAALLTSIVCFLFLGSWSSTMNVLLAIPTSILGTFIVTYFSGFTLNTFTLLGLTLAVGIVVDDAIMVLENIVRHQEKGDGRVEAALKGTKEITFAAIAATISILAIFIPVVFMEGIIGRYFFQFGVTIAAAVSFSLLEALTLTPMRCSRFLEAGERGNIVTRTANRLFRRLAGKYRNGLEWCLSGRIGRLERRWAVVLGGLAFFALSLVAFRFVRSEFLPPSDQSLFTVSLRAPVGSSLQFTDAKFRLAEDWVRSHPAVKSYFSNVGGFGGGDVSAGNMFITLKEKGKRPRGKDGRRPTQQQVMAETRKALNRIPGLRANVQDPSMANFGMSRGYPIEFTVRGPDWVRLVEISDGFMKELGKTGLVTDLDTDYRTGMPEVRVFPDRAKAYDRGVSVDSIGTVINAMVGGIRAGYLTQEGRRYEVRVRAVDTDRMEPAGIGRLMVRNSYGEMIPLDEVTQREERSSLLSITRRNRERAIGITGNVATGASQADVMKMIDGKARSFLPDGYRIVHTGSAQTYRESYRSLLFALWLGILVAYMVLGSQFNSFIHPLVVLLALPFSVSGALVTLLATGKSLNIYSLIGLLLLMGIVKKNSILLVDFINRRREEGLPLHEALVTACPIRLRPILMTSIATVAAALPPALAMGAGAETRQPMALAVIGGVVFSTALTLFVVPCAYSISARLENKKYPGDVRRNGGNGHRPRINGGGIISTVKSWIGGRTGR